eukprot:gene7831-1030_t
MGVGFKNREAEVHKVTQVTPAGEKQRPFGAKRGAVAAGLSSVATVVTVIPKCDKTKKIIEASIKDNILFSDLPRAALLVIIDSMRPQPEGSDESTAAAKVLEYGPGNCFGELALLFSAPRAATVCATSDCKIWVMDRAAYNTIKRNFTEERYASRHKLLDSVAPLKVLSPHSRAILVDALTEVEYKQNAIFNSNGMNVEYKQNETVFLKGDVGNDFFIIKEGSALVKDGTTVLARLQNGQFFGDRALRGAETRAADVVAETRLVCYALARDDFNKLLGSYDEIWRFDVLQNTPLLCNLSEPQLMQLAKEMQTAEYKKGQLVLRKGDPADNFYIIQSGQFSIFDDQNRELAWVGEGSCFGELALLQKKVRAANVMALENATVLTLSVDQFNLMLGNLNQLQHVWRFEALRRVPLLISLDNEVLIKMAGALEPMVKKKGEAIVKQIILPMVKKKGESIMKQFQR